MSDAAYNAEELAILKGAKIVDVVAGRMDLGGYEEDVVRITVELVEPIAILGQVDAVCRTITYEVWQDPEGNGPGHIALVEATP